MRCFVHKPGYPGLFLDSKEAEKYKQAHPDAVVAPVEDEPTAPKASEPKAPSDEPPRKPGRPKKGG